MNLSLESRFDRVVNKLDNHLLPLSRIYPVLDLTRLDLTATAEDIKLLVSRAEQDQVAAICVFPNHLEWIPPLGSIQRATVANFPSGNLVHERIMREIDYAIGQQDADEIDYVFAYPAYLNGKKSHALAWCREVTELCHHHGRLCKVILETGALQSLDMIYQLSSEVVESGCDMLKTSTGKINIGATLTAVFAMLSAIKAGQTACGIKISGGIKTPAQASAYIHLAEFMCDQSADKTWFRIGTSQISRDV